jgi:hypothetical protein
MVASAEIITINAVPDAPEVPVLAGRQPDCDNPLGSIEVTSPLGAEYTTASTELHSSQTHSLQT